MTIPLSDGKVTNSLTAVIITSFTTTTTMHLGFNGRSTGELVGPLAGSPAVFTVRRIYVSAVLGVVILSVRPSVCHTRAL